MAQPEDRFSAAAPKTDTAIITPPDPNELLTSKVTAALIGIKLNTLEIWRGQPLCRVRPHVAITEPAQGTEGRSGAACARHGVCLNLAGFQRTEAVGMGWREAPRTSARHGPAPARCGSACRLAVLYALRQAILQR